MNILENQTFIFVLFKNSKVKSIYTYLKGSSIKSWNFPFTKQKCFELIFNCGLYHSS